MTTLLVRGLLAGLIAAGATFVFAQIFGEPQIDKAIAYEEAHTPAPEPGHAAEPEVVSRDTQSTFGLGVGVFLAGVALGGIYAVVFAFANGRIAGIGTRGTALVVAALGFVVVYLVPFLKYPPNPPAVGNEDTIGRRTVLYISMVVLSILIAVVATNIAPALCRRFGTWNGVIVTGLVALALLAIAYAAMPGYNDVPAGYPANVLYGFRMASLGAQFVLWTTLGLAYGAIVERDYRRAYETGAVAAR
jgi:predicted cobalt transporter CbtA